MLVRKVAIYIFFFNQKLFNAETEEETVGMLHAFQTLT